MTDINGTQDQYIDVAELARIEAAIETRQNVLREKREKLQVLREIRAMEEDVMEQLWREEREMVRFYSMQECRITCTLLSACIIKAYHTLGKFCKVVKIQLA